MKLTTLFLGGTSKVQRETQRFTTSLVKKGAKSSPLMDRDTREWWQAMASLPQSGWEEKTLGSSSSKARGFLPHHLQNECRGEAETTSQRTRHSIRGPDAVMGKPEIMSQEGLLKACTGGP